MHRFFKNKAYIYKPLLLLGYMSCLGFPFTKAYTETTPQPSKNTMNSSRHMTSVQDLSLIGPLCDGSYSSSLSTWDPAQQGSTQQALPRPILRIFSRLFKDFHSLLQQRRDYFVISSFLCPSVCIDFLGK